MTAHITPTTTDSKSIRRVLSIDGGGIKGVFPASFLASVEEVVGWRIADYFDLIVGTSTGGIIALGLGLGLSAKEMLEFYVDRGPAIFGGNRWRRLLRSIFRAKYQSEPLRDALLEAFGDRLLGDSDKRLVIPSLNLENGEVHLWKTAHHPRFTSDWRESAVSVALATAAAPTYFPTHRCAAGTPLVDGGMWANNPVLVSVVECIGILGWAPETLRVLSLGCTSAPLDILRARNRSAGVGYWAPQIAELFMVAQASSALGMAQHLVPDRRQIFRISPLVSARFGLDQCAEIPSLKGLGNSEARRELPALMETFFTSPTVEKFSPFHGVGVKR